MLIRNGLVNQRFSHPTHLVKKTVFRLSSLLADTGSGRMVIRCKRILAHKKNI